jgi:DNA-binding transcriptional LysR family regulator
MAMRHIEAFRAVMLAGSMTEAARRMHTSQPQVSRLVSQLEAITQFQLFHRSGSRLTPTVDGLRFFQAVEKTFIGLAELESAASGIRSFSEGRLSVAAMPRLAAGLLARIVARFKAEYPDVMVTIQSGNETAVNDWIASGLCDLGLAMLYGGAPGVQVEQVYAAPCVAIMPKGHALAAKTRLSPMDFDGEPFISFPMGSPVREQIDGIFRQARVSRVIAAEAGLGASICALVGAGLGLSLINPLAANEEQEKSGIEIRPFSKRVTMSIALLFPPYKTRTRLVSAFTACARDVLRKELNERRGHP